jgi:BirA family biotin operon repressor/biotin-[acetyl-CoA-carboxylase] ligase
MPLAATLPQGYRRVAYVRLGSTNDEARRCAEAGAAATLVVTAEEQTAGRGQQGRVWHSPPGNLFFSLLLRPPVPAARSGELTFVAAVALVEALRPYLNGGRALRCKWPNDVLIDGRKVSGILLEGSSLGTRLDWIVAGIGLNLKYHPAGTPWPATDLAEAGAAPLDFETALEAVLGQFAGLYRRWLADGFGVIAAAWDAVAYRRGEIVALDQGGGRQSGRLVGIDGQGALILETSTGTREAFSHGTLLDAGP